jgi:hypothetical protein
MHILKKKLEKFIYVADKVVAFVKDTFGISRKLDPCGFPYLMEIKKNKINIFHLEIIIRIIEPMALIG